MLLNKLYVCVAHLTVNAGSEHREWLPQAKSNDQFIWRWWTQVSEVTRLGGVARLSIYI